MVGEKKLGPNGPCATMSDTMFIFEIVYFCEIVASNNLMYLSLAMQYFLVPNAHTEVAEMFANGGRAH